MSCVVAGCTILIIWKCFWWINLTFWRTEKRAKEPILITPRKRGSIEKRVFLTCAPVTRTVFQTVVAGVFRSTGVYIYVILIGRKIINIRISHQITNLSIISTNSISDKLVARTRAKKIHLHHFLDWHTKLSKMYCFLMTSCLFSNGFIYNLSRYIVVVTAQQQPQTHNKTNNYNCSWVETK